MHVFTYGSLMYSPVWERVVTGSYRALPATVRGYARRRIAGEVYPALVDAESGDAVEGVLYLDVSAGDLAALDRFEGEAYERIAVRVEGEWGGAEAWTYRYRELSRVEPAPWEPAAFERDGLARFLATYCRERGVG